VRNIHVRYEDRYTNPKQPFSIGVTLKELLFRVGLFRRNYFSGYDCFEGTTFQGMIVSKELLFRVDLF